MSSKKEQMAASNQLEDLNMDMSPMIDLVFLLLIFFMVASTVIIVPIDAAVEPPIALAALPQENTQGRILVNIRADGTITTVDPNKPLAGPDEDLTPVQNYITDMANDAIEAGFHPVLHVRADREVNVKRIREVVEAGADAQVIDVVFASFADPNKYN